MKILLKLKNCGGFIAVDTLILAAVLTAAAVIWSSAGTLSGAQRQNFCRTTAVFLAQGKLNETEYAVENGMAVNSAEETVHCNDEDFTLCRKVFASDGQFLVKVKVSWYYENNLQEERQERTVYRR